MTGRVPRLGSVVAVAVAVLVLAPVAAVAWRSVRVDDAWSLDAFTRILGSPRTWRLVGVTVLQALVSTAVTLAVGLPVAWVLGVFRFPGRRLVRGVALVPFVLPSVVLASAVAALLGPAGVVDLRGTWWAVLTAHAAFNLAVVVFVVGDACGRVGPAGAIRAPHPTTTGVPSGGTTCRSDPRTRSPRPGRRSAWSWRSPRPT